jgi:DNA modification methylase
MARYFADEWVTLYCGDARCMAEVGDECVDLVVTSPPYWDIKNYRASGQLGLGQSYEEYWSQLGAVLAECRRVLRPGRALAIVIGTRISDGELKHIPADLVQRMPGLGFTLRKEIIWVKPKGTQGLWQRGTTQFLKDKPHPGCLNINIQHEFILIFAREGEAEVDTSHRLSEEFIKEVSWSVWPLPVSNVKGHPAPFPEAIPRRLIELYTSPGEVVLDPFLGSGTTAVAARDLGRRCIGYELSEQFCELAKTRIEERPIGLWVEQPSVSE